MFRCVQFQVLGLIPKVGANTEGREVPLSRKFYNFFLKIANTGAFLRTILEFIIQPKSNYGLNFFRAKGLKFSTGLHSQRMSIYTSLNVYTEATVLVD